MLNWNLQIHSCSHGIIKIKLKPMVESILSLKDNIFAPSSVSILKLSFVISAKKVTKEEN